MAFDLDSMLRDPQSKKSQMFYELSSPALKCGDFRECHHLEDEVRDRRDHQNGRTGLWC